jgi:hypothetical protein
MLSGDRQLRFILLFPLPVFTPRAAGIPLPSLPLACGFIESIFLREARLIARGARYFPSARERASDLSICHRVNSAK